jgi:MurNAc alpha-1-phosphate uridylyltransferase
MLEIPAMILAAGRGERMRPLSDHCPKPLLSLRGKPLIEWQLHALARGGFRRLVINTAWLGEQIEERFGARHALQGLGAITLSYSHEGRDFGAALETAGGVARALPLLCPEDSQGIFWLLAGDVYVPEFQFSQAAVQAFADSGKLAHIWLVPNPAHNPRGDFALDAEGLAHSHGTPSYTYSTIGLYRRGFFASLPAGNPEGIKAPLAPLLRAAMDNGQVTAELYLGAWADVGTPQRLAQLNAQ